MHGFGWGQGVHAKPNVSNKEMVARDQNNAVLVSGILVPGGGVAVVSENSRGNGGKYLKMELAEDEPNGYKGL